MPLQFGGSIGRTSSGDQLLTVALVLGFILAAIAAGFVSATGQAIPIALVVGTICGIGLLSAPTIAVWIVLVGTLLISGPLFFHVPELSKGAWLFSLMGFFLLGVAMLYPVLGTQRLPGAVPRFIALSVVFMVAALASVILSNGSLNEIIASLKRTFQYWGLMFLLAVYPFKGVTVRRWFVFLGLVALMHLVLSLYQRLVIVPQTEGLIADRGFVALDMVVGAFEGAAGGGGSSSVMGLMCVMGIAFVLSAYAEKVIGRSAALIAFLVIAAPLVLGETKIVVLWLPIVLLAINLHLVKRNPGLFALTAILVVALGAALIYVYAAIQVSDARPMSFSERLEEQIAQNFGSAGYYGAGSLNRTTAITYWWEQHGWQDPVTFMFGHGIGSSYGGDGRVPLTGHMHDAHRGKAIGLTGVSTMLWDLGLAGLLLYYSIFVSAALTALRLAAKARPGFDAALCKTLLASACLMLTMPVYTDLILQAPSLEVLCALTFGLIAWRYRHGANNPFFDARSEFRDDGARPIRDFPGVSPVSPMPQAFGPTAATPFSRRPSRTNERIEPVLRQ